MSVIIEKGLEVLCFSIKAYEAVEATKNAFNETKKQDPNIPNLAAQAIFASLQAADIGFSNCNSVSANAQLSLRGAVGAADVTRQWTNGSQTTDIVLTALFRLADSLGFAVNKTPNLLGKYRKHTLNLSEILNTTGFVVQNRDVLAKISKCTYHGNSSFVDKATTFFKTFVRCESIESQYKTHDRQSRQNVHNVQQSAESSHARSLERNDDRDNFFGALIQQVINWQTLESIPEILYDVPTLQRFRCAITDKPLRFALAHKDHVHDKNTLCYEKIVIERWIQEKPGQRPPHWAGLLPVTIEQLSPHALIQEDIDATLQQTARDYELHHL